jgi:hypothetical protein
LQLQGSVLLNVRYACPHSDQGSKIWPRASSTHTYRSHIYNANIRNTVSVSTKFADAANKAIFRSTIPRNRRICSRARSVQKLPKQYS